MDWYYSQPVKIVFGNGKRHELSSYLPKGNGFLITSPSFIKSNIAQELMDASHGKIKRVFYDVSPNPDIEECRACCAYAKEQKIDFIVALGGGSVMDLAKVVSVMVKSERDLSTWMNQPDLIPEEHVALLALPTTAGTGSEMTCIAVISDHVQGKKVALSSPSFYPMYAIVDPELTYSVPPQISASTGLDVLCHAIEAYWSKQHQPICDALSIHAIKLVFKYLKDVYLNPKDAVARENMAEASLIAGLAFTIPKTTAAHACSYPLTSLLGIPHGEACAFTISYFIRLHDRRGHDRTKELALLLGFSSIEEFASTIDQLKDDLGMLHDLKRFDVSKDVLHHLILDSQNNALKIHPIEITQQELEALFQSML